ncbi:HIUase/Transthyretin-like protein [Elsinoe fawcettii]|nr:HIUase/Transthyretin-like protein [Elsinoe fawcettii]
MASQSRPFITCHVLDQTKGRPAGNVNVTLRLVEPSNTFDATFTAQTDDNGRVNAWSQSGLPQDVVERIQRDSAVPSSGKLQWRIVFETEKYWQESQTESFYPEVEIKFYTDLAKTHFHVPLLLGPWGYTTYRGS